MQTLYIQTHLIFNRNLFVISQTMKNVSLCMITNLWKKEKLGKNEKKDEESITVSSSDQGLNQAINSHIWANTHLCFSVKKLSRSWRLAMCNHKRAFLNCSKMQNVLLKTSTFFIQKAPRKCLCLFFWAHYTTYVGLCATTGTFKCIKPAFRPRFVTKEMVLLVCILGAPI